MNSSFAAVGPITFSSVADYSNSNPPTGGLFRDFIGPTFINRGTALNFTSIPNGSAGGDNYVTLYDTDPTTATPTTFSGSLSLSADILFAEFNNAKAGGFVFLFNEGVGQKGLSLMLWDAGNTDHIVLHGMDQSGPLSNDLGKVVARTQLPSANGGQVGENTWYRFNLNFTISGDSLTVVGSVFNHTDGLNPNSALGTQIGTNLVFVGSLSALGVTSIGEIGLDMRAVNMDQPNTNMVSITNFSEVPEPSSFSLLALCLGLGGVLTATASRRKRA